MTADRATVPAPPTHLAAATTTAIAALGWVAGLALTEIDAQRNLPDPIINGAWSVAIAGTVVAVLLTARQSTRRQIEAEAERTRADLAALDLIAEQIDQISTVVRLAMMPGVPEIIVVRDEESPQYQQAPRDELQGSLASGVLPEELMRKLSRDAYALGVRAGERRARGDALEG
jgi:hypothetical protein